MDVATNLIFRSIGSIYNGTISSSTLYPTLYFDKSGKTDTFYGFHLREVIPTRLITRLYEENKKTILDMIWLVDDSKIESENFVSYLSKNSTIEVSGESKKYVNLLSSDATIDACYPDLLLVEKFFDQLWLGSRDKFSSKLRKDFNIKISNVPTKICAYSKVFLENKHLNDEKYQDDIVNAFLSLIDLIHRSFEILSSSQQDKSGSKVYCVRCGHDLPSDSYYCPLCGSKQN